jgi:photosystem II stability/assembly factor-like uncharacterized protein
MVTNASGEPIVMRDMELHAKFQGTWSIPKNMESYGALLRMLARSPSGTLYVARAGGTWRSTDNGHSWNYTDRIDLWRTVISADAFYSNSGNGDTLGRSTDEGATWHRIPSPFGAAGSYIGASDNSSTVYAWSRDAKRFALSTNQGDSWQEITTEFKGLVIAGIFTGPSVLFLSASDTVRGKFGLYRSLDRGANWQFVSETSDGISALRSISPAIVVTIRSGRAYRSSDSGATWRELPFDSCPQHTIPFKCLYSTADGVVYLGSMSHGLWSSADQGVTWAEEGLLEPLVLPIVGGYQGIIYMGGRGRGWESSDNGVTWSCNESGPEVIDSAGRWYCTGAWVDVSSDRGVTWKNILGFLPGQYDWRVYVPVVTPRGTLLATFYSNAGGEVSGIIRTRDGTSLEYPLRRTRLDYGSITVSAHGTAYYVGDSLFRSVDDGLTWNRLEAQPRHRLIRAGRDETVYSVVLVDGRSVPLRSRDMGDHWQTITSLADSVITLMPIGTSGVLALVSNTADASRLLYSPDHGDHFVLAEAGLGVARPDAPLGEFGGTSFLATDKGLYRTVSLSDVKAEPAPVSTDSLTVWPVPARDLLHARLASTAFGTIPIELLADDGRIVLATNGIITADGSMQIDIRSLASGSYTVSLHLKGETVSSRFVVIR